MQKIKVKTPMTGAIGCARAAMAGLLLAALVACGGGGGSSPNEVPNANNHAPSNVKLLEVSSVAVGQITASWLPATDDATLASNLIYQLHASTDAGFKPSSSTKVFEGRDVYQALVSTGLTAGVKYTVKLLAVDGQGASTSSEGLSVTVANTAATTNSGAKVTTLQASQVAAANGNQVTLQAGATNLQVGQFIASPGDDTSKGYLKKIESISTIGNGNTVLQTRDASINEVISNVQVSSTFRMGSVPAEVANAAQQTGLARAVSAKDGAPVHYNWPQTGYRYRSTPTANEAKTPMQLGLVESSDQTTETGSWGRISAPTRVTLNEKENGQFNLNVNVFKGVKSGGTTQWTVELCKVELGAVWGTGDDSKPAGVQLSQGAWKVMQSSSGHNIAANVPINVNIDEGVANTKPYKVKATLYLDSIGEGCNGGNTFATWEDKVTTTLEFQVVNDVLPKAEKVSKSLINASGDFTINNDFDVSFDPDIKFEKIITDAKLTRAEVRLTASPKVIQTLTLSAKGKAEINEAEGQFDLIPARTFFKVYQAGPVPIVISGKFKLQAQIVGNVTGAMTATEVLTIGYDKISTGFIYENGGPPVPILEKQPVYKLKIGGNGNAQAMIEVRLQPSLELTAYELTTGKVLLEPYVNAHAGVEGHVQMDAVVDPATGLVDTASDADYRLTQADISGGVRTYLFASLHVLDVDLWTWPENAKLDDVSTHQKYDLIPETIIVGIPSLTSGSDQNVVDPPVKHPSDSRALRIHASATNQANPLGLPEGYTIRWAGWNAPRIVSQIGISSDSYSILPTTSADGGESWAVFTQPGTYTVRQGGYSSLGGWARQYIETTLVITDDNGNNIPDWWEQRYGLTGASGAAMAAADPDGDGLSNLQEWQQGTDPKVSNGKNTINTTANPATIGQTIQLWITDAWSTVKSVVFSFADGVANFVSTTVAVVNGVSDKVNGYFTKSGTQTVTVTYKDANGNTVGTGTLSVTVNAAGISTTAAITSVQDDSHNAIANNASTTDSTPKVSGTLSAALASGQIVRVYDGGTVLGQATVSGTSWTLQVSTALASGSHTLKAVVFDGVNLVEGANANTWTFTVQAGAASTGKLPHTGITTNQCFQSVVYPGAIGACTTDNAINLYSQQDGMRANVSSPDYAVYENYSINECVKDNITGLMWEGKSLTGIRAANNVYTNYGDGRQGDASEYVKIINDSKLCGFSDWRIPSVLELENLLNYGKNRAQVKINEIWFPNTIYGDYITDTKYLGWLGSCYFGCDMNWIVSFGEFIGIHGRYIDFENKHSRSSPVYMIQDHLRLVRGDKFSGNRFEYSSNGEEVKDRKTGLVWRRCVEGMKWNGATCVGNGVNFNDSYFSAYVYAKSQFGWRIPSARELFSLIDPNFSSPAIDKAAFPNTPYTSGAAGNNTGHISVTPYLLNGFQSIGIDFEEGDLGASGFYLRMVK